VEELDCKSEEGLTVGMIDSVMTQATVLRLRLDSCEESPHVREALLDLADDPDVKWLLTFANKVREQDLANDETVVDEVFARR
jgi:hypothetical protein